MESYITITYITRLIESELEEQMVIKPHSWVPMTSHTSNYSKLNGLATVTYECTIFKCLNHVTYLTK